jgi:hypothetical protein
MLVGVTGLGLHWIDVAVVVVYLLGITVSFRQACEFLAA